MTPLPATAPYTLLQARGTGARAGEALNVGVVLHAPQGPLVALTEDARRLAALHPDFAALQLADRGQELQAYLRAQTAGLTPEQRHASLRLFAQPFDVAADAPALATLHEPPEQTLQELMTWLVLPPARTLKPTAVARGKRPTKLAHELRDWLRGAKAYSAKIDDIGRGKVVSNYPIDPGADLYADFAVLNGKLNAIETLDLRGVERLTPSLRGDAAIKGITLDEARAKIDGKRLVVLSATDYAVARPAIQLISRYADDVLDMHEAAARQRLADFIASALHRDQLPGLAFAA